jgi:hypothetical protein
MPAISAGLLPPEVLPAPGAGVIVLSRSGWPADAMARYDGTGKELWVSRRRHFETLGRSSGRFVLVQSGPDGAVLTPFDDAEPFNCPRCSPLQPAAETQYPASRPWRTASITTSFRS